MPHPPCFIFRPFPAKQGGAACTSGKSGTAVATASAVHETPTFATASAAREAFTAQEILYNPGQTLAQAVYLSGLVAPPALCSGLGNCGRCRLRVVSQNPPPPCPEDVRFFSAQALQDGWRLGCRHISSAELVVQLPEHSRLYRAAHKSPLYIAAQAQKISIAALPHTAKAVSAPMCGAGQSLLAVDLGTTSLQWLLMDAQGLPLQSGSMLNPQMGAGSDVISRISAASTAHGAARLQQLVVDALTDVIVPATTTSHTPSSHSTPTVGALCLAANSAMTYITLGKSVQTLATAPYSLPYTAGEWVDLSGLPPTWVPPQLSPFVGGDISAGYAALTAPESPFSTGAGGIAYPFLLADLGTNGEFLLALSPTQAITASVALGPALEGIGLRCGTEARPSAVTGFSFSPHGLAVQMYADPLHSKAELSASSFAPTSLAPVGITGTGYISLLHQLLQAGAMDRDGHFTPEHSALTSRIFGRTAAASPLRSAHGGSTITQKDSIVQNPLATLGNEPYLPLPGGLFLTATDVEEILKVKAAFSAGLQRLLPAAGIASHELRAVYLAGALGFHVDVAALENLGFFPHGLGARSHAVGNTSLTGAALLVQSESLRQSLAAWASNVQSLDLAADSGFAESFTQHMRFVW